MSNEVHYTDHMMTFVLVKDQTSKYVIYHEFPFDNFFQYALWSILFTNASLWPFLYVSKPAYPPIVRQGKFDL